MANTTIYPYGTNGQLPSSIGVINDLTTGGADKALSAEMGKRLRKAIVSLLNALSPTAFTGEKPTDADLDIYAPKFTITLPTDTRVDMTNQNAQVEAGDSYTNTFSLNETAEEGETINNLTATMEGGGTISVNGNTISTANVTGNIVISASVGVAPMKVHSYDFTAVQKSDGRVDGKPRYIEDDIAGHFRLYSVNNITQNSEATENDPAWVAPKWSPNSGSYKGSWANGISNNYRAGYGNRVLDLEPGKDFTIILKGYALYPATGNRYNSGQIYVMFYDRDNVGTGTQLVTQQFYVKCGIAGGSASVIGNTGSMYPIIMASGSSDTVVLGGTDNAAAVPASPASGDVYDVVYSYVAQTGLMSAFVVKRGSSSEVLVGGTMTRTGLAITAMQVYGYGPSVPTNLKGLELYNYAMDKSALEALYGISNN